MILLLKFVICNEIYTVQRYCQNITLVVLLLIVSSTQAHAQLLQWSNPTKIKGAAVFTKVLGENEKGVYILRYRNRYFSKSVVIDRYNHLLSPEASVTIDLKNARLIRVYMTKDGILLVKSKYNKSSQKNDLVWMKYSFDLSAEGEPMVLESTKVKDFGDRGNFRMRSSDDLTKLMLVHTEEFSKDSVLVHFRKFDIEFNLLSSKDVLLPYASENFVIKDFKITNTGEGILHTAYLSRDRRKVVNSTHSLYVWSDSSLQDFVVADEWSVHASKLVYHRDRDDVSLVAYYGYKDTYGTLGVLFYKLNSERTDGELTLGNFSNTLIDKVKVNDRNNGAVSEGYEILDAIPRSDGGMLVISEQKEVATEDDVIMVNGIPQSVSKNVYNFNELLILNYDDSAYVDWHKVITKNQTTVNDGGYFSSVVIYVGPKYLRLLYNDQIRSSGDVMEYTLYNNGKSKSSKLLKSELEFVAIIPSEAKQVSSNKVIIPTSKNRRFSLLKIVYN